MARLKSLRASLVKNELLDRYDDEIAKLLAKGFAEKVPDDVVKINEAWYLPHRAVVSDKKPGKVRVVFDCSSRYKGESLNDRVLQGPDLNNKLQHVLLRFRRHQFAVMADVEAMYNQVRVPVEDRDYLRFLWENEEQTIQHYRMSSHLFGGVWCASVATYALRRAVQESENVSQLVSDTVNHAFYVDDCLQSVSSRAEAIEVIHGTQEVLQTRGFNLTKFVVNDESLLMEIPEDKRASEVKDFQADNTSKVLGIKWNPKSDNMYFDIDIAMPEIISRRSMLSLLSSTFDPLGMLSPALVVGKIMFQEATRLKLDWDDKIPDDLASKWCQWVKALQNISSLKIPRCVKPAVFDDAHIEIHNFSDASEKALGICSYLRCINKDGKIHTALLYSKSRVAPLKTTSIPRLELQAALLAAKCDSMIREEMHLDLAESHFWVDSQIVLQYIYNEKHRLHVYVGNRVGEIRRLTKSHQWHHISGNMNPADVISRGTTPDGLVKSGWLNGPDFLRNYKENWSYSQDVCDLPATDPEVRSNDAATKTVLMTNVNTHPLDVLISHFSSWYKLKRAVCWWDRLIQHLRSKVKSAPVLGVEEIKAAEMKIIRHVQEQQYGDEVKKLKSGLPLQKSSSLKDLTPFLDPHDVLCVGGRIQHASMQERKKHPFIIPHRHKIARMIIEELHNVAHIGVEWTLSMLRTKYWVTRARIVIKSVKAACVTCKKLFAGPCVPQMANLPVDDLSALSPNHLLLMKDNLEVPPGEFKMGDMYRKRWRYVQHLVNQFWRRWQKEYIPELMKRHKWTEMQRNIQVGDLILLMQENTPRGLWPLGIIVEVMNGRDGLVRSVRVRTSATTLVRPITKIVLLEGVE